ncbi:MAG: spore coat protein [Candidatus Kerfeldbacteria bacterium CG08_land_8_20_14_0_20_40_16]|uniref:Spore coat protein n=1 Tax=Candidatus Kerfeldbacteria bacterium CG08_land_8_20_14_0_20_40_16 TaxID=2014244 RepID=A0A2H0YVH6_9BACT|nr:MAG: spore coat protein [Candidatus Kerfeldbacteria bacterium CG08_land_8_20_14_0_20_40_16]
MIDGVKIKELKVHQDIPDREEGKEKPGFLMEVLRDDDELLKKFGQTTFTVAYEGTIKAFHYHKKQDDLWFVATGKAMVVLHDLRNDSPTKGETQVIYTGKDDYKLILIPEGVAHGYKVVSKEPVLLFYHTTESYDAENPDEERLPFDDPQIGFDWETDG